MFINIPFDKKLTKKDLIVNMTSEKIYVATRDKKIIYIDGEWTDKIAIDDLNWSIIEESDRKILEIYVTKWRNTMNWWDSVIKTEPKIDTSKINPEPSKISDLEDGEMK